MGRTVARTVQQRLRASDLAHFRREVRAALQTRHQLSPSPAELENALNYPSVASLIDDDGQFEDLQHVINNAVRYLPRVIRKRVAQEQRGSSDVAAFAVARTRPPPRQLDSRHGMAYALALKLQEDADRWANVLNCRQHYWQQAEAPFPWLGFDGRQAHAMDQAVDWLQDQEEGEQIGPLMLHLRIETSQAAHALTVVNETEFAQPDEPPTVGNALGKLLSGDLLDDVQVSHVGGTPHLAATWLGWTLSAPGREIRVSADGPLRPLHQTCQALSTVRGWNMRSALQFVLTGEPPSLIAPGSPVPKLGVKALSFDHIALLQLKYMTPGDTAAQRLHLWDRWLTEHPEENFSLTFQSRSSNLPTAESQRMKWMTSELRRAYSRALALAHRYLRT